MAQNSPTSLVDDLGRALDAEYLVEADDGHLALILASRSGNVGLAATAEPGLQPGADCPVDQAGLA